MFTFHGEEFVRVLLADKVDFANIAFAKQTDLDKAAWGDLDLLLLDGAGGISSTESTSAQVQG